jgi:hypothetical protein
LTSLVAKSCRSMLANTFFILDFINLTSHPHLCVEIFVIFDLIAFSKWFSFIYMCSSWLLEVFGVLLYSVAFTNAQLKYQISSWTTFENVKKDLLNKNYRINYRAIKLSHLSAAVPASNEQLIVALWCTFWIMNAIWVLLAS